MAIDNTEYLRLLGIAIEQAKAAQPEPVKRNRWQRFLQRLRIMFKR